MRKIIIWLLLVMCFSTSKAQDLVITISGDSINYRIDGSTPKSILRIATPNKNDIKWKNLNLEKVGMFSYGFYSSTPVITKSDYVKDLIYPRWRFSTDIGYAKIGDTNGVILNLDGNYYLNKNLGFGLLIETYNTNYKTLEIKKKSTLYQFFGVLTYRKLLKEKKMFFHFLKRLLLKITEETVL